MFCIITLRCPRFYLDTLLVIMIRVLHHYRNLHRHEPLSIPQLRRAVYLSNMWVYMDLYYCLANRTDYAVG